MFDGYPIDKPVKDRVAFIRSEKSKGNHKTAQRFWLLNPKGISRKKYDEL